MTAHYQHYRRRAYCKIVVNGQDVTARLDPHLLSVVVIDTENLVDKATIELDDRDARLQIPPDDAPVQIYLGWAGSGPRLPNDATQPSPAVMAIARQGELRWEPSMLLVFNGWVESVESGFARKGGGRRLWIEASGGRMKADMKTPMNKSWGEGDFGDQGGVGNIPLSQVFQEAAQAAGLEGVVAPALANIKRDFWYQHESFMQLGSRLAHELGGAFKISGNRAILVSTMDNLNADGATMSGVEADWGINLISWRIKPFVARPQFGHAQSEYYKILEAEWAKVKGAIGGSTPFGGASAISQLPAPAPNAQYGGQINDGMSADSRTMRGVGWAIINGEPAALAGRTLTIHGARPGVDGSYRIDEAEHKYTRNGGYTTRCNLKRPEPSGGYGGWGSAPD